MPKKKVTKKKVAKKPKQDNSKFLFKTRKLYGLD